MKKPPCARLGMRMRPNASEKPDESRNSRPPKATLFRVWMIQNCMRASSFRPRAHARGPESITTSGSMWHGRSDLLGVRGYGFRARGFSPAPRNDNDSGAYSKFFAGGQSRE